ncbi:hypothetical protein [Peribacillus loiseleuriae]|uniref:hypothetical protein n=1 Tax=Peribacillus loiseleuriae TaxID=1679170 RepID=UPI003D029554
MTKKYRCYDQRLLKNFQISAKWISGWSLYQLIKKRHPDAIYQYRVQWLGNQSLDIYAPSQKQDLNIKEFSILNLPTFLVEKKRLNIEYI